MTHPIVMHELIKRAPGLFRPGTLLNVGANRVRFELGSETYAAGRRITLLEIWPANADHYRNDHRVERVVVGDVRELFSLGLGKFDACLWWHGPEHIAKEDLAGALAQLERAAESLVVLGCPYGIYPQGEFMGNPYETHRAALYPEDFKALGYQVATVGERDHPDGSIIAWKGITPAAGEISARTPHVVMVTHGERVDYLQQTIPAVLATAWPLTLTVVANAPGSASLAYLREMEPQLYRLIVNRKNLGKPAAANQGWRLRDADYTMLLDDDALALEPDWLRKLVDIADCAPEVGIVGHSLEGSWTLQVVGRPVRTVQVQPSNLGAACMLVPRRTVERCGHFNEELPIYGEEDALYGWKVRRAGMLCAYFDHNDLGRSFAHLGIDQDDNPAYWEWKRKMREAAIPIRDALIREYEAGRPLNQ